MRTYLALGIGWFVGASAADLLSWPWQLVAAAVLAFVFGFAESVYDHRKQLFSR